MSELTLHRPQLSIKEAVSSRAGAVVVLINKEADDSESVIFIRRSLTVRTHKGQVSLPGGMVDLTDTSIESAGLREVHEEIGIDPSRITIKEFLPTQNSLASNPVFALVANTHISKSDLALNPDEVSDVFFVPIDQLTSARAQTHEFVIYGRSRHTYTYLFEDKIIWGLTAKIIHSANF